MIPHATQFGSHNAIGVLAVLIVACLPGCDRQQEGVKPAPAAAVRPTVAPRQPPSPARSHELMLDELSEIRAATGETINWLGDAKAVDLRRQLAEVSSSRSPAQ